MVRRDDETILGSPASPGSVRGIPGAENCTELLDATIAAVEELPDVDTDEFSDEWDKLTQQVDARAQELIGPAIARGAELEALLCNEAISEAQAPIAEVFEDIADMLEGGTTSP